MATFVLVHGAMHGSWCWRDVRHRLEQRGHIVRCPTLTGQGDRRSGLTPDVGIETHVGDLEELLWFEDLSDVHLVLHSYAGVLAGPLAARAEPRLASIVYFGAFVTGPGQSLLDVEPPEIAERYRRQVAEAGDGWFLPPPMRSSHNGASTPTTSVGRPATDPLPLPLPDRADRLRPRPARPPAQGLRRAHCSPVPSLGRFLEAAVTAIWETHELASGHDMMLSAPDESAALLERIAQG